MDILQYSPFNKVSSIRPAMPNTFYAYILFCSFWETQLNIKERSKSVVI